MKGGVVGAHVPVPCILVLLVSSCLVMSCPLRLLVNLLDLLTYMVAHSAGDFGV